MFINDKPYRPQTTPTRFESSEAYNTYIQRGNHDIQPENITFIISVVQSNPDLFAPEVATLDDFTEALSHTGVSFIHTGQGYIPFYQETVTAFSASGNRRAQPYPYTNTKKEKREKLYLEDLMSPAMLLHELEYRIEDGELTSPYDNETK